MCSADGKVLEDIASPDAARLVPTELISPSPPDPVKAASATIFYKAWQRTERDRTYRAWRADH